MYQLFIFIQSFSRYQRHDIDASTDIITLKALQRTNSKILTALMAFDVNPSHAAIKISINATAAEFIRKNIFPIPVHIKKIIKK